MVPPLDFLCTPRKERQAKTVAPNWSAAKEKGSFALTVGHSPEGSETTDRTQPILLLMQKTNLCLSIMINCGCPFWKNEAKQSKARQNKGRDKPF